MDFDSVMGWTRLVLLVGLVIWGVRAVRRAMRRRAGRGFDVALKDTTVDADPQRQRTPAFKREIVAASQLPLKDAALALWQRKPQLDREDLPSPRAPDQAHEADPAAITVIFDWENAHYGPTFLRLKAAHPEASDLEVQAAIKSAIRLAKDCNIYFSYTDAGVDHDAQTAVALARNDNLGFQDATYDALREHLRTAMR